MPAAGFDERDLTARHLQVTSHFPTALGVDDWIARVETVLATYGFTGDNTIAMTNLCRDEVTSILKEKIETVFGSSFNTNGLGGVLTCGVTGMKAGLSHSPVCANGRERYVFFSFPHIAIDSQGNVGSISRPGRQGHSNACGALNKCLHEFKAQGYLHLCQEPGVHDPLDPEYSILRQRLARRLRYEKTELSTLALDTMTSVAERTITNDLEYLIERTVDHEKADYAVVTGIQIHNWSAKLTPHGPPSLEFVAPTKFWIVMNGKKTHLDLRKVPSLSPRQLMLLSGMGPAGSTGDQDERTISRGTGTTLQEVPYSYLTKRLGGAAVTVRGSSISGSAFSPQHSSLSPRSNGPSGVTPQAPASPHLHPTDSQHVTDMQSLWQASHSNIHASERDRAAPTMDSRPLGGMSRKSMIRASPPPAAAAAAKGLAAAAVAEGAGAGAGGPLGAGAGVGLAAMGEEVIGEALGSGEGSGEEAAKGGEEGAGCGEIGSSGGGALPLDDDEDDDFNTSFLSRIHEKISKWADRVSRTGVPVANGTNGPSSGTPSVDVSPVK